MIVCMCRRISDSQIRRCAEAGARSPLEVFLAHGTVPNCGSCLPYMDDMLADAGAAPLFAPALAGAGD